MNPDVPIRVVVVGSAAPARGGIPSCVDMTTQPGFFAPGTVEVSLLNTTRATTREAGRMSASNLLNAVTDAFRTWRVARRNDVVHIHAAPGRPLPAARAVALCGAARLGGARVICHIHSARLNSGRSTEVYPGALYRFLVRRLALAHQLLTVSEAGVRTMRELVPGRPVDQVDNAVDVESFPTSDVARQPAQIVFVGTLSRRKGLPDLCAALTGLRHSDDHDGWTACIVGGGNEVGDREADEIRREFASAGLGSALVGTRTPEEIKRLLAASAIFVLPSYAEGQPIAILEAMAAGVPIVATSVGAIPDVVDSSFGIVVEPGDVDELTGALRSLVTDPDRRSAMGRAARARALRAHDTTVLADRLVSVYRSLVLGNP